ncbi:MAG: xylulokinase [Nitrososphaerales archaeon]
MPASHLLGIDAGTTGLKAVLADADGTLLAQASREYATRFPQANWAEQDPEQWWAACCEVAPQVLATAGVSGKDIAAIGVSGQGVGVVPVDADGAVLRPAIIWMDRRSDEQCRALRERVGEKEITRVNGGRIDAFYLAPKWLWVTEHEPEVYRGTAAVLQANGYITFRLTGVRCMDLASGPLTLFFDSARLAYSEHLAGPMGIDLEKMPPLVEGHQVIGQVTREAARATGLAEGTPVVGGAVDGTAAAVEGGLLADGDAVEMTGQSTVMLICASRPYLERELFGLVHGVPGKYLAVGGSTAAGGSLRWWRDTLADVERERGQQMRCDPFQLLTELAAGSPPGANRLVFLPYMFGERSPIWDSDARGVFFGLSLSTTKADMVRAILEGAAYGLRHNVEAAGRAGFAVSSLGCVGGGARSDLWNQIKADVLGRPVRRLRAGTGAPMGDIMMAGVGVGVYRDFAEAMAAVVEVQREYLPNPANRLIYDDLYGVYLRLYPALREQFVELARAGGER